MTNTNLITNVKGAIDSVLFCGFEKGELIFRGQVNSEWDISPSLFRQYPETKRAGFYEAASVGPLFLNIKSPFVNSYDPLELIMTSQHFGQPTRLVDWTNDILVGLFFACYDPKKKETDKNGRLTIAEKSFFKTIKSNSLEQNEYKSRLIPEKVNHYTKRFNIDDIHIIEPMIKNPRMRVQEGCFMFFPWKFHNDDENLLTLHKYIREQNKWVDNQNKIGKEEHIYIFIVHKDVAKEFKSSILKELDDIYGISEKTLFIDSKYSTKTEKHFIELKLHAERKSLELLKKTAADNVQK
jgi:hypothetical protein